MGPTKKVFKFGVEVCEWLKDGKTTYSVRKSFKDKNTGAYIETHIYFGSDLLNLRDALDEMIEQVDIKPYGGMTVSSQVKHKVPPPDDEIPF